MFWFGSASDALLQGLYARADGLIAASYGEGFGIPLIEAGRAGLPLLVRELPVFREVTQGRASFFPKDADVNHLAAAIAAFLSRLDGRNPPFVDTALPCQSWQQSAVQVVAMLGMVAQAGGLQPADALPTSTRSQENGRPHPLLRSARRFKRLLRRVRHRFQGRRAGALGIASLPTASPLGLLEGAQPWLQALERQRASKSPKAR